MSFIVLVIFSQVLIVLVFPGDSDGEESACNVGDLGSTPESRRSLGKGNDYILWYSCLENTKDKGAWWVAIYGVTQCWTRLK